MRSRWRFPILVSLLVLAFMVVADLVLNPDADPQSDELKDEILRFCRQTLPRHLIPTALNFVPALTVAATGKVVRHVA